MKTIKQILFGSLATLIMINVVCACGDDEIVEPVPPSERDSIKLEYKLITSAKLIENTTPVIIYSGENGDTIVMRLSKEDFKQLENGYQLTKTFQYDHWDVHHIFGFRYDAVDGKTIPESEATSVSVRVDSKITKTDERGIRTDSIIDTIRATNFIASTSTNIYIGDGDVDIPSQSSTKENYLNYYIDENGYIHEEKFDRLSANQHKFIDSSSITFIQRLKDRFDELKLKGSNNYNTPFITQEAPDGLFLNPVELKMYCYTRTVGGKDRIEISLGVNYTILNLLDGSEEDIRNEMSDDEKFRTKVITRFVDFISEDGDYVRHRVE